MARSIVSRSVIVGPILMAIAWATRGVDGLVASAIGMAVVAGYFIFTGLLMSRAARISLAAYHAGALFGFILRLALIMVTMVALTRMFDVDRYALGFTIIAAYIGLLVWEAAAMSSARRIGEKRSD
jgi:hypothetical protein